MGVRPTRSACGCEYRQAAPDHHDRLLRLESNAFDPMVELIEIAATWHELEYGECEPVLGPDRWIEFAATHSWRQPERIMDLMLGLVSMAKPSGPQRSLASVTAISAARSAS